MKPIAPNGEHITWQRQTRTCGKQCKTCSEKGGHGPYWYAYWRDLYTGKLKHVYVGKNRPANLLPSEESLPANSPADAASALPPAPRRRRRRRALAGDTSSGYCLSALGAPLAALPA